MIIDIHTHTFPDAIAERAVQKLKLAGRTRAFTDGTVAGLRSSMDRAGVDYALVLPVATSPRQVIHVNDSAAAVNERFAETGVLSLAGIHPDFEGYREELARVKALGFRGIKIHPQYQGVDFDDIRYLRILDRCGELGLLVYAHGGLDIGLPGADNSAPEMVLCALEQVGPVELMLAHMGAWHQWDRVEALLWDKGVYLDTSYTLGLVDPLEEGDYTMEERQMMSDEQFVRMVRKFGPERIFFGTDSPWKDQKRAIELIRALPLEQSETDAILGGNAARLLGIGG